MNIFKNTILIKHIFYTMLFIDLKNKSFIVNCIIFKIKIRYEEIFYIMKIYTAERLNPCCSFLYGTEKQSEFDLGEKSFCV